MPTQAADRFLEWIRDSASVMEVPTEDAKVIVIPWASERAIEDIVSDFVNWGGEGSLREINVLPVPLYDEFMTAIDGDGTIEQFCDSLRECVAIFISGGDQNKICDIFEKHPIIKREILACYEQGKPVAGTSAGAAVMSNTMITGDGEFDCIDSGKVGTRVGLGFVTNIVIDQHFLKRQRFNRLISVMAGVTESFGLGVDEDVAVALVDNRDCEVLGNSAGKAILLTRNAESSDTFTLKVLHSGCKVSLYD